MKRSVLICFVSLLFLTLGATLLTGAALISVAAVYVGDTQVDNTGATAYWINDTTTGGIKEDGADAANYNVKYEPGTRKLTLKDARITKNYITYVSSDFCICAAVYDDSTGCGDLNIVLEGISFVNGAADNANSINSGIYCSSGLNISGAGELNATGSAASGANSHSNGVQSFYGSVTISGNAKVTATGGAATYSRGISCDSYSTNVAIIDNAIVTATGGAATRQDGSSYGVFSYGDLIISNAANVTAIGGTAKYGSTGMYGGSGVRISGGTITAKGGTAADVISTGISGGTKVEISGGTVTATGDTAQNRSFGVRSGAVEISGGTVTATGGKAIKSCGVYGDNGNVTISGGTVNASGDTATESSHGVSSDCEFEFSKVEISGGTVTAKGGTAKLSCGVYSNSVNGDSAVIISDGTIEATGGTSAINKAPGINVYTANYIWYTDSATPDLYNFKPYNYSSAHKYLSIKPAPAGTPSYNVIVSGGTGSGYYSAGVTVKITAIVPPENMFKSWIVNTGGVTLADANAAVTTFVMPAESVSLSAIYQSNDIKVAAEVKDGKGGKAYVSLSRETPVLFALIAEPEPNTGWKFKEWTKNGVFVSYSNPYIYYLSLNTAGTYTAVFEKDADSIVVKENNNAMGKATNTGSGKTAILNAIPNEGYSFADWSINDEIVSYENPYRFDFTDKGKVEITARFEPKPEKEPATDTSSITVETSNPSAGTAEAAVIDAANCIAKLTATQHEGYYFIGWQVNGAISRTANPCIFKYAGMGNVVAKAMYLKTNFAATPDKKNTDLSGTGNRDESAAIVKSAFFGCELPSVAKQLMDLNGDNEVDTEDELTILKE